MGIPFYFASLLRNHKNVLRRITRKDTCVNLCLDSNSIVYDCARGIEATHPSFETELIARVCAKIESYIELVRPTNVFIAFDGPPPMAKMKQQRERRYKGAAETKTGWDTVQITPGTTFMLKLDEGVKTYFQHHAEKFGAFKLSVSSEPGEGEQKIFEWLRGSPGQTFVYGLDSDLIILALQHLKLCPICMVREFKEEMKLLDVSKLGVEIETLLGKDRLNDYIFLMFFMGNDFLPHFPALNLRTKGLDTILQTYKTAAFDNPIFDGEKICWRHVEKLLQLLGDKESVLVGREYRDRNSKVVPNLPENKPLLERELEHYINPCEKGWEHRYYTSLLKVDPTPSTIGRLCSDYFQMLNWNSKYYTGSCPSWNVYYPHMYPPLLKDLAKHVPKTDFTFPPSETKTIKQLLEFVLPSTLSHYSSIPLTVQPSNPEVYWAFTTFYWESHLLF